MTLYLIGGWGGNYLISKIPPRVSIKLQLVIIVIVYSLSEYLMSQSRRYLTKQIKHIYMVVLCAYPTMTNYSIKLHETIALVLTILKLIYDNLNNLSLFLYR
jgi:hypothetical protein